MRTDVQRAREYELMTIFAPDVPEEELPGAVERVGGIIAAAGGNVTLVNRESPWGRRRLAYPIRYNSRDVRDGIYVLYYFEIDPTKIVEIERDLRLTSIVIRFMVTLQVAAPMVPAVEEPESAGEPAVVAEPEDTVSAPSDTQPEANGTAEPETLDSTEKASPTDDATANSEQPEEESETQG